jgi:hypothetical protein
MEKFIIEGLNDNINIVDVMFDLNELLFSCTYNGLPCNASDFVQVSSFFTYSLSFSFPFFFYPVHILKVWSLLYV